MSVYRKDGDMHIAVLEVKEEKMKKVMLVIVCLLFAATAFAQQSDPSNDVGYVKISNTGGAPSAFGLPFKFWNVVSNVPQYGVESTQPSSIIGAQIATGGAGSDNIVRQDGGQIGFRFAAGNWGGSLQTTSAMGPGHAYYYVNRTGLPRDIVLAGDVDNTQGYRTVNLAAVGPKAISWRDTRELEFDNDSPSRPDIGASLIADGFRGGTASTSDLVTEQGSGSQAFLNGAGTLYLGTLAFVTPGRAYYLVNRTHVNGAWNYNYGVTGAAASMNDGVVMPAAPAITKVPMGNDNAKIQSVKTGAVKTAGAAK